MPLLPCSALLALLTWMAHMCHPMCAPVYHIDLVHSKAPIVEAFLGRLLLSPRVGGG